MPLDRSRTLPPLNMTPAEAVAIAVALHRLDGTPFHEAARTALHKLLAVMPAADVRHTEDLAGRIHLVHGADPARLSLTVVEAFTTGRSSTSPMPTASASTTRRHIEPVGYLGSPSGWYLLAWCRLRDGLRSFRVDRIQRRRPPPPSWPPAARCRTAPSASPAISSPGSPSPLDLSSGPQLPCLPMRSSPIGCGPRAWSSCP